MARGVDTAASLLVVWLLVGGLGAGWSWQGEATAGSGFGAGLAGALLGTLRGGPRLLPALAQQIGIDEVRVSSGVAVCVCCDSVSVVVEFGLDAHRRTRKKTSLHQQIVNTVLVAAALVPQHRGELSRTISVFLPLH